MRSIDEEVYSLFCTAAAPPMISVISWVMEPCRVRLYSNCRSWIISVALLVGIHGGHAGALLGAEALGHGTKDHAVHIDGGRLLEHRPGDVYKRQDQGHEEGQFQPAYRAGPVQGYGVLCPVQL